MTVPVQVPEARSTASGSTGTFALGFGYEDASHVQVSVEVDGVETLLTQGDDFTVSGGNAVIPPESWPPAGAIVRRWRTTPIAQGEEFGDAVRFQPVRNESAFDRLTRVAQDQAAGLARAVKVPIGDTPPDPQDILDAAALGPLKADKTTTVTGAGLASGGGSLAADRTITVSEASEAAAQAGEASTGAMTPRRTTDHFNARTSTQGRALVADTTPAAARARLGAAASADPDFTGQIETFKAASFDNENTAALRLKGAVDTSKMLTGGFDETEDFGYFQASKPGDSNKPMWLNPNGGPVGAGSYRKVVTLTAAIEDGSPIVQVDVSVDRPNTYVGAVVSGTGIPNGTTVIEPVDYSPTYIPGSGDPFTTKPMTLSANATATNAAVTLTLTYERDLTEVEEWLTNRPQLNGDGAADVLAYWVEALAAQIVPGFLRAYGADFSSEKEFHDGGTEGGYVHADGYVGRRFFWAGYPLVYKAFFPFGINMPMDFAKELAAETTRTDATECGNVWTNITEVPIDKAAARIVDSIGGPGFGDQNFVFNSASREIALFAGSVPGQATINDLPTFAGARLFPYSVAQVLGQGASTVYDETFRYYRSRALGIAYGEYHNHLLRPSEDGLVANETSWTTGTLVDLDFNRFDTAVSNGSVRLIPQVRGARITIRNETGETLKVYPYLADHSCTTHGDEILDGFASSVGKHFLIGQGVSGSGIPGGAVIEAIDYDINGNLVLTLSAAATNSTTTARSFGDGSSIEGAGSYDLLDGHEAAFHCYEVGQPWRVTDITL